MIDYSKPIRKTTITGKNVPVYKTPTQEKTATPKTVEQVILPDENYNLSKVTIEPVTSSIDDNIQPQNILLGKTILGVQGNLAPDKPDQSKTVTPTTSQQVIRADTGYELAQVTVEGVTSDIDSNIQPLNIREGVTILGVEGNLAPDKPDQSKTVNPTTSEQVVMADEGYELASVTVTAVTNEIDSNIQAGNIKDGVTILGVTGTLEEGITPTGQLEITENGVRDVTQYASVNVNVPSGEPTLGTKTITANGTYNASDDNLDGYSSVTVNVTSGGSGKFASLVNRSIAQVTAEDLLGVTSIGKYAFSSCFNLTSVEIPSSVTSIGQAAFSSCFNLTSITIPSGVTIIDTSTFDSCSALTSITIPSGVTSIGNGVFGYCRALETVTFEENSQLASIGSSVFYYCTQLTNIEIPSGVTSIGSSTFNHCDALETVTFGANSQLESIGIYAFRDCYALTSITIPSSVTSIGSSAFRNCDTLTTVTLEATTPPTIQTNTFDDTVQRYEVPAESVEAYKTATNWANYADKIFAIPTV